MATKNYNWHKIAESIPELEFANDMAVVEVKGKRICIAGYQQQWFGFAFRCPHAGAPLPDGYIDAAGNIVCPMHRYKFSMKNGLNTSGEGYYLKTYPVTVNEDGVFVGIEEKGIWGW